MTFAEYFITTMQLWTEILIPLLDQYAIGTAAVSTDHVKN